MFKILYSLLIGVTGVLLLVYFINSDFSLKFVDSARYADVARNLYLHSSYTNRFVFPTSTVPGYFGWDINYPPLHAITIANIYFLFGPSDFSVIFESILFFFASAPLVFLLANQLFNKQIGLLSVLIYLLTPQLINYSKDGASEPLFIFLLLLTAILITRKNKLGLIVGGLVAGLLPFAKLQGFLFLPIFFIWVILLSRNLRNLTYFSIGPFLLVILNQLGIFLSSFRLFDLPLYLSLQQTASYPGDNLPRSGLTKSLTILDLITNFNIFTSKIFYNLYNFYKIVFTFTNILPSWTTPFIVITYIFSQVNFLQKEETDVRIFRFIVLIMVLGSFLLAAATSPHIRYTHTTLPFVIILITDFLYKLARNLNLSEAKIQITMFSLIFLFLIMPLLGNIFLDKRFENKIFNIQRPYAHKLLGQKLGHETSIEGIIITNLDSWGSWYGNRNTMLIPLDLTQLEQLDQSLNIGAIYLTDFQKENEDHPLRGEWEDMYNQKISNKFILENFKLQKIGTISAEENYENRPYTYKIWKRSY